MRLLSFPFRLLFAGIRYQTLIMTFWCNCWVDSESQKHRGQWQEKGFHVEGRGRAGEPSWGQKGTCWTEKPDWTGLGRWRWRWAKTRREMTKTTKLKQINVQTLSLTGTNMLPQWQRGDWQEWAGLYALQADCLEWAAGVWRWKQKEQQQKSSSQSSEIF